MALTIQGQPLENITSEWGKGFWALLAFTTQMVIMLSAGYVLATAPLTERLLDKIVGHVHSPRVAIVAATVVGGLGSYVNWGFLAL
jgi:Short chain fatty acids transporter